MTAHRFNPAKLDRLNDVGRLTDLVPDAMWAAFGTPDARSVIEIGAGTGMFAHEFADRMEGGTLYAVDSEPVMLDWMREHLGDEGPVEVMVVDADASAVPLPDAVADLVYTVNLHHELDDPTQMIAEARRLLRTGGTLAIVDWKREVTPKGPPMEHRVGVEEIQRQMESAGCDDATAHDVLPYHNVVTGVRRG